MISFKNKNILRTLEPHNKVKNKNADFKNPCSYKMKSVYRLKLSSDVTACQPSAKSGVSNDYLYLCIRYYPLDY